MKLLTPSSPHFHASNSVTRIMLIVLLALVPGLLTYGWFFGAGVYINLLLACVFALGLEALMLKLRNRPLAPFLSDGSALVTAFLLALSIPPIAPWWITLLGVFFAIVVAKHLYGGLGHNPFNPAMVGYAILLISFPREMTSWVASVDLRETSLGLSESLQIIFGQSGIDSVTGATPLDHIKTQLGQNHDISDILRDSPIFGELAGKGFEWVSIAFLLGGLLLIHKKIISWQIPAAVLISLAVCAGIFHLIDPEHYASPTFHLFAGATMLCAFFIATDPVSACTTPRGRIYFGIGIGVLIFVIRTWGGYPDAVAFAVLLMNLAAPTIDYYTRPRVFGYTDDEDDDE
ncbi:MAG: electron transport complex subunit RsxD [Gammaproteobacteria bacterium]|nr:electron transport complex subunit RsxD [Gammaproteobacteria bacterium]